ncbi:MAG TPA: hypothetical protein VN369_07720 [Terriglobales bacterium]|nr:hypothetical protein [Terriglobales bacterium]
MTNKRFFALLTALLLAAAIFAGCTTTEVPDTDTPGTDTPDPTTDYSNLKIGQVEFAAHGTRSFCVATAVVAGDKVVAAYIDEFQYLPADNEKVTGVPNSDADFGAYVSEQNLVLGSKRVNADYYSENMKNNGGATQRIDTSFDAIEDYCVGMTVGELDTWVSGSTKDTGTPTDAITGSTLTDTASYVKAIAEAAKAAAAK